MRLLELAVSTAMLAATLVGEHTAGTTGGYSAVGHAATCCGRAAVGAGYTQVGTTKDACGKGNAVRVHSTMIAAGETKIIDLPAYTRETIWYCGDRRERCANDQPYNAIQCSRAGNGAIFWTFLVKH